MKFLKFRIFTKEKSPNSKIFAPDYECFTIFSEGSKSGQPINKKIKLPKVEIVPELKYLPDVFSPLNFNNIYTFICSNQLLEDLKIFKLSEHSISDISIFFKGDLFQFNFLHFPYYSNEIIDFSKSKFSGCTQAALYADSKKNKWEDVSVSSYEDFKKQYEVYNLKCTHLVLKENNELDFFWLQLRGVSGFYISERCGEVIKNKGLTGFEFVEIYRCY